MVKTKVISLFTAFVFTFSLFLTPVSAAATVSDKPVYGNSVKNKSVYAEDEVIVKFEPSMTSKDKENFKNQIGISTVKKHSLTGSELVKIKKGFSVHDTIEKLKNNKNVIYAEPNHIITVDSAVYSSAFDLLWGLNNTGQDIGGTNGVTDIDIDAPEAWGLTQGSQEIVVGIIDTGIDIEHPALRDNIWINAGEVPEDGIDNDQNGFIDDIHGWDFYGNDNTVSHIGEIEHGTHVAGIVAGNVYGDGFKGVAPNVRIMPIPILGPADGKGTTSDAIEALGYAKMMGVKITNNSWGGAPYSEALRDAINSFGGVFVAAAGNNGQNTDVLPFYPASYDCPNIVSVTAINNRGELAWFANYGSTTVDIAAPGVDILSCIPDSQYGYLSGTSMAAPYVSGTAALMLSMNPVLSTAEVSTIIKQTSAPLPSLQDTVFTGGTANAYNAVLEARSLKLFNTDPLDGAQQVPLNKEIKLTFSKEIEPGGNFSYLTLKSGPIVVPYDYTISGKTLILNPVSNLEPNCTYMVDIPYGAVQDTSKQHFPFSESRSITFTTVADYTAPILLTTDPVDGATGVSVDRSVYLTFDENITNGPDFAKISIKSGSTVVESTNSINGNILKIDPVPELSHLTNYTVNILPNSIQDVAGNAINIGYSFSFLTEEGPPSISIVSPSNNLVVLRGETVKLTASATDDIGINRVEFYCDGILLGEGTQEPGSNYSINWTALAGRHSVTAKAYDIAGNNTVSQPVTVSGNTTVTVMTPPDGSKVKGTVTSFRAITQDPVQSAYLYIDNIYTGASANPNGTIVDIVYSWDTSQYADGTSHIIEVRCTSTENIVSTGKITVITDNSVTVDEPLSVNIVSPTDGNLVESGELTVFAQAFSTVGVSKVEFYLDNYLLGEGVYDPGGICGDPGYKIIWQAIPGIHILNAKVYDTAGNSSISKTVTFKVPTVVTITSPANGVKVSGIVTKFTAVAQTPVKSAFLYIDGKYTGTVVNPFGTNINMTYNWDTSWYSDGLHEIEIRCYTIDDILSVGKAAVTVDNSIDLVPPSVSITSPSDGNIVQPSETVTLSANASDAKGVTKVEFYCNNVLMGDGVYQPSDGYVDSGYKISWQAAPGINTFTAKAYDAAGNSSTSSAVTVKVPTVVTITSPANGVKVSGSVTKFTAVAQNPVKSAFLYIDGKYTGTVVNPFGTNINMTYNWDTSWYSDGLHEIEIRCYTIDDILSVGKAAVTVDNSIDLVPPSVSITSPSDGNIVQPGETVTLSANASDAKGVTKVEFYCNNVLMGDGVYQPSDGYVDSGYKINWQAAPGINTFTAKAYDAAGNSSTSSAVTVKVPTVVTITSPANGGKVSGIISRFAAVAQTPVKSAFLYIDGKYTGAVVNPFGTNINMTYNWDTNYYADSSTHLIEIKCYTVSGDILSIGRSTVTVDKKVSVTNPVNGSAVSGYVTSFSASTTVPVKRAELYIDGFKVASLNSINTTNVQIPYSWNTYQYADWSTHVVEIRCYTEDTGAEIKGSSKVTVNNQPPDTGG